MKLSLLSAIPITFLFCNQIAFSGELDTRGGTCDDAKSQHEYYCLGDVKDHDIFTQANIACNNARRNLAAACEGISEEDYSYHFDEGTPKDAITATEENKKRE